MGTTPRPTESTRCGRRGRGTISDSYTPGAIAHTRTGTFFKANSVARSLVRWDAAALEELYPNYTQPNVSVNTDTEIRVKYTIYMILGNLDNTADAGYVDHARRIALRVFTTFCKQPKERHGHEVD